MDPINLTPELWDATRVSLQLLGGIALTAIIAGGSLLLAHAIIPSAISTRSMSDRWIRLRPMIYVVGAVFLALTVAGIVLFILSLGWIGDFYPRYWQ